MVLLMKSECEKCLQRIEELETAYICVHECTFCHDCTKKMDHICPNCGGELVRRPKKSEVGMSCPL